MSKPVWVWWLRGESEDGLTGFVTKKDREKFRRGEPARRVVSRHGNTWSQTETWDGMMQRICDEAGVARKSEGWS